MKSLYKKALLSRFSLLGSFLLLAGTVRGEQMLELFNCTWNQVIQKMPEIAEAGYDSLWLPNPAKGTSGGFSVGYDVFDPFDLGSLNQAGTVATMYGTEAQCLQMVQIAHRFGIRVYFDNVMNHRGSTVPGYNSSTPTNFYPAMVPQDFHLQTTSGGFFVNWPDIQDYNNQWDVQNESLAGLVDIANEPGSINDNFGNTLGSTITKPVFVRQPSSPALYMDTNLPSIGGPWHPFDGHGQPVAEDVNAYLIRAVMWTLWTTKCDGFRLDAVKHVPSPFFGDSSPSFNGYTGGIQAIYDYTHGYGSNVTGNGYIEADDMRNSCFDSEVTRNDALLFGEHLGPPPTMGEYILAGMRLLNTPLHNVMNGNLGMPARVFTAWIREPTFRLRSAGDTCFPVTQGVQYAQNQDSSGAYASHRDLQDAYYSIQQGIGVIYSDNYNQSGAPSYFPTVADANYLGEYGDNQMPELRYLQNQLARGLKTPRWSDSDVVLFERYDNREGSEHRAAEPGGGSIRHERLFMVSRRRQAATSVSSDERRSQRCLLRHSPIRAALAWWLDFRRAPSWRNWPPGRCTARIAHGPSTTAPRAPPSSCATPPPTSRSAQADRRRSQSRQNRAVYVGGQTLAPGGGAIECKIPAGSYVCYGYQWPEPSRAALSDAITLRRQRPCPASPFIDMTGPTAIRISIPSIPSKCAGASIKMEMSLAASTSAIAFMPLTYRS